MDEKINISYIDEFEEFRKNNIFNIPNILFIQYLNVIYPNLVFRESDLSDINEPNTLSNILPQNIINNKTLIDKSITSNSFNQYLGIQNLISERIFKYIDKSKKGKLSMNDFCSGMHQIFFGNISELSKLSFFICDFNEDRKIYKSDMKLILSYIPLDSDYLNQQDYIKKINKIIDEFFNEIIEENSNIKGDKIEEIDYDFFLIKVTDGINDNKINGAFFLFIKLLKYIFINIPFNSQTINSLNFIKDKHLLKATVPKGSQNKSIYKSIKKLTKSEAFDENSNNINNNNVPSMFTITRKKDKKYTDYKLLEKKDIENIQQKDLFSIKKCSSVKQIVKKIQKRNENLKHDYIIAKNKGNKESKDNKDNKDNKDINIKNDDIAQNTKKDLDYSKTLKNNKNSSVGKVNFGKTLYFNNQTLKLNNKNNNNVILRNKSRGNTLKNLVNSINNTKIENKTKNNILPSISRSYNPFRNNLNKTIIPDNKLNLKVGPKIKIKNKNYPLIGSQNEINISNKISCLEEVDANNNNNKEKELGFYLYKLSEEEYHISLKKYFAVINKKEILFFSSKLKNELCTIWNLNDTVVHIMKKISINKLIYYPIKIIYKNNFVRYLLFEEKEPQIEFGKRLKINIKNNNFEDNYEATEKIGEGHFAVVKKCIEKKSGKEYAVKMIIKQKLTKIDLELILQEKYYMKLIKHPNIVSLIEDFEDEKYIYLVMDYYKGGDLCSYMSTLRNSGKTLSEKSIAKIIKILAQCIQYLNYFGIVHRDLKPENIVFGIKDDFSSLALIDLGVAITLSYGQMSSDPVGTLDYISPEIFTRKPYAHKVDVWSLGVILYILFTMGRVYPFDCDSKDKKEREKIIGQKIVFLQHEYPKEYFGNKSKYLISLIDKSLEKSPEKRISIDDFLNNYWLINNSK